MSPDSHKWLDMLQHLSYYLAGLFAVATTVIGFLWRDRNANKQRIINNEKQYEQLAWVIENRMASKDDLLECSKDKDRQHHEGIKDVIIELNNNAEEHVKILETMNAQHSETLNTMLELHKK